MISYVILEVHMSYTKTNSFEFFKHNYYKPRTKPKELNTQST